MTKFIVAVVTLGLVCAVDGYYVWKYINKSSTAFQTLDLNKVVNVHETILASRNLSPEELTSEVKYFANRLQDEIQKIQKECDCALLVTSAVVAPSKLPDRTEEVLSSLGFTEKDLIRAQALLERRLRKPEGNP